MNLLGMMAGLGIQFNANEHAERNSCIPAGWYKVQIVNSEVKPGKNPGAVRLNIQFKVIEGDYAGKVIFGGYNIKNSNPVAVQISLEELAELSRAVNTPVWNDTQELHAKPFNLKAKIKKSEGYDDANEPSAYKTLQDMDGVVYVTKAQGGSGPATFGGQTAGFTNPANANPAAQQQQNPAAQQAQTGWNANVGQQQTQQQVNPQQTQQVQQNPVQQQQVDPNQQQQTGANTNFQQAVNNQPWGQNTQQQNPAQTEQPAQQQQQQHVEQQIVQQQQQVDPSQQQAAQGQQGWANNTVAAGTEQPAAQQQQQVQEQPQDDIAVAAQAKTPPWKKQAE